MKVSIVTISFNQRPFLERAIRSVLDQDHRDIEYIIVDPGSTDGSRELIARHADRLAAVVLDPDDGPADGLNAGFRRASGEVLGYINADDALLPGAVSAAVRALDASAADVASAHGFMVDAHGRILRHFRSDRFTPLRFVYGAAVVMQQSTFFRHAAFRAVGGFNPDNRTSWDAELLLDFALAGCRFALIEEDWSIFTLHANSITGSQRLSALSRHNHERMFAKVMGRRRTALDTALRRPARLLKWAHDPRGLGERARERIFGPRRRHLVLPVLEGARS